MLQRSLNPLVALVIVVAVLVVLIGAGWFLWGRRPRGAPPSETALPQPPGLPSASQPPVPSPPPR